jgi:hypothetical protein
MAERMPMPHRQEVEMSKLAVTVLVKDYHYLMPLACGNVATEDLEPRLDRDTPGAFDRTPNDASVQVGELSYARYLARIAYGAGVEWGSRRGCWPTWRTRRR